MPVTVEPNMAQSDNVFTISATETFVDEVEGTRVFCVKMLRRPFIFWLYTCKI